MILTGEKQSIGRKNQWQFHLIYHKCHSGTKPGRQRSVLGDYTEQCVAIKD